MLDNKLLRQQLSRASFAVTRGGTFGLLWLRVLFSVFAPRFFEALLLAKPCGGAAQRCWVGRHEI